MVLFFDKLFLVLKFFGYAAFALYTFIQLKSIEFQLADFTEILTLPLLWMTISIAILEALHNLFTAIFKD